MITHTLLNDFQSEIFTLVDGKVVLNRVKAECVKKIYSLEDKKFHDVVHIRYFKSEEKAIDFVAQGNEEYTIIPLDVSEHEWLEGMEFDSWENAKAACDMGEAEYKRSIATSLEQQLVDIQMALIELAGTLPTASE